MTKVVITGAAGFLGSNLIKRMERMDDLIIYALSSKAIESVSANVIRVHKDCIDGDDSERIIKNAIVINCAYPRNSTGKEIADGLSYINKLFMTCKRDKAKAVINISSQSVYSQKRNTIATEENELCLESPYAVGKFATELMLDNTLKDTGIAYSNLRMASLIGPGFDQRIVNRLIKKAQANEPINITISDQRFGFLDVNDAVEAIISLVKYDSSKWKHIYNVGNGNSVSLKEIIDSITDILENKNLAIPLITYTKGENTGDTSVSYERLSKDTGYEPKCTLKNSIECILDN